MTPVTNVKEALAWVKKYLTAEELARMNLRSPREAVLRFGAEMIAVDMNEDQIDAELILSGIKPLTMHALDQRWREDREDRGKDAFDLGPDLCDFFGIFDGLNVYEVELPGDIPIYWVAARTLRQVRSIYPKGRINKLDIPPSWDSLNEIVR